MSAFTDLNGRQWNVTLTVRSVKRVNDRTGILLTRLFDDNCALMSELWGDIIKVVDVLWCIVEGQHAGVDAEGFAESLGGDVLGNAAEALGAAAIDFFPNPEQRASLRALLTKGKEMQTELLTTATATINELDAKLMATAYMASASNTPASPESSPGDSPLANCA